MSEITTCPDCAKALKKWSALEQRMARRGNFGIVPLPSTCPKHRGGAPIGNRADLQRENAALRAELDEIKTRGGMTQSARDYVTELRDKNAALRDKLTEAVEILKRSNECLERAQSDNAALREALENLLSAVTSKRADDSNMPIAWSGSPSQNRAMYAAIDAARAALVS